MKCHEVTLAFMECHQSVIRFHAVLYGAMRSDVKGIHVVGASLCTPTQQPIYGPATRLALVTTVRSSRSRLPAAPA